MRRSALASGGGLPSPFSAGLVGGQIAQLTYDADDAMAASAREAPKQGAPCSGCSRWRKLAWLLLGNPTGDPSEPDAVQGRGTRLNFEGLL